MKTSTLATILALALSHVGVAAARLRRGPDESKDAKKSLKEIREGIAKKWDSMDEFLEVMFGLACKAQHGKDVHGLAASKLKDGSLQAGEDFDAFMKSTQANNVQMLTQACGSIVAQQESACRQSCADRWGTAKAMEKRDECDEACVEAYGKFEKQCKGKAENLELVYKARLQQASAKKNCMEGHCPEFPTIWMMDDPSKMDAEVDKRCGPRCEEAAVKQRCQMKFQLEADFVKAGAASKCSEDKTSTECFAKKKGAASDAETKCQSSGKEKCGTQYDECKKKGNVDKSHKEAGEFCESRKKMCETQVTARCLDEHKKKLDAIEAECNTGGNEAFEKCKAEEQEKRMTTAVESCTKERMPKCVDECHQKCNVAKMNECLGNLKSDSDPVAEFCTDFWDLLHRSSELDPVTGAPIVLLDPAPRVH